MLASLNARVSLRESLQGSHVGMSFHLDDLPTTGTDADYASRVAQTSATTTSMPRKAS